MGRERQRTGVRPVSDTSIQIDFTFKGIRCRERIKLKPSPANLKRAEQHRYAILDAIEKHTFDYATTFPDSPNRFKFAENAGAGIYLEEWLETWIKRQKAHLKSSTLCCYRKDVYNVIIPALGKIYLPDLKRSHIRELCEKMEVGNKRLSNLQSLIRSALQEAINDELIETNPLYGWTYARKEAPTIKDDIDPFTQEEQAAIIKSCRYPQEANLFQFAFWTGMRTSELAAVKWGDIDWLRGTIKVSRAKTQAAEEAETTKTRKGTRDIKLLSPALDALTAQKQYTFLADEEIFINPRTNKAITGDQQIRTSMWLPALKKAGVRYRRPYQTRHTYASMMLTAGESPIWLANQMGHADTGMIFRIYGRLIPDAVPEAGGKAVEMFTDNKKQIGNI
jgi:integrase